MKLGTILMLTFAALALAAAPASASCHGCADQVLEQLNVCVSDIGSCDETQPHVHGQSQAAAAPTGVGYGATFALISLAILLGSWRLAKKQ